VRAEPTLMHEQALDEGAPRKERQAAYRHMWEPPRPRQAARTHARQELSLIVEGCESPLLPLPPRASTGSTCHWFKTPVRPILIASNANGLGDQRANRSALRCGIELFDPYAHSQIGLHTSTTSISGSLAAISKSKPSALRLSEWPKLRRPCGPAACFRLCRTLRHSVAFLNVLRLALLLIRVRFFRAERGKTEHQQKGGATHKRL